MRLIIGGYGQGKLEYTLRQYSLPPDAVVTELSAANHSLVLYHFEQAVRVALQNGDDPVLLTQQLVKNNPSIIVICDEVGCGVVPIQQEERLWREAVGRICCQLAEQAESVERVFCGLAMRLK